MNHYVKIVVVNLILFLVLFELASFFFIKTSKTDIYWFKQVPTYVEIVKSRSITLRNALQTFDSISIEDPISPRVIDTLYSWCTWHPKSATHRGQSECFDVIYKFDSLGIRGSTPDPTNSNTVFFIGDSFVEGFGLNEDSTISERFKQITNLPVVNLGCSGSFGTTQMTLVYEFFAELYAHQNVYILFYLNNDFFENNIHNHDKAYKNRYRPYRNIDSLGNSQICYKGSPNSSEFNRAFFNSRTMGGAYRLRQKFPENECYFNRLLKTTYSRRVALLLKVLYSNVKPRELIKTSHDWDILATDLKRIIEIANNSKATVSFINLPSKELFQFATQSKLIHHEYLELEQRIEKLVTGPNANYLSFYNYILNEGTDYNKLFFSCDSHYSNTGVSLLSKFITSANYSCQ